MAMAVSNIIFAVCAPLTFTLSIGGRILRVKVRPATVKTAFACVFLSSPQDDGLAIARDDFINHVLKETIISVEIDGEQVSVEELAPPLQGALVKFVLSINGLTPESANILYDEAKRLKENVKAQLKKQKPPHNAEAWMGVASAAYAAFSSGGNFAASTLVDEPFIALFLANIVAEAERENIEEESRKAKHVSGEIPSFETPAPKGKVNIVDEMRKIFESITNIPLPPKD